MRSLVLLVAATVSAQEAALDHYSEGVALYENGQVEDAAFAFERAVRAPGANAALSAKIQMYLGVVRAQLNDLEGARDAFRQALKNDPKVGPLPSNATADVVAMFEKERAVAKPTKSAAPFLAPEKPGSESLELDAMGTDRAPAKKRPRWVIWAAAGGTAVFMTVAILAGASASSAESAAGDRDITVYEAQDRLDTARSRARLANVFWGLTLVGAIGTGVLYYTW